MRLTLDPVPMWHWYLLIGAIDFVTCLRVYSLGFRHYGDKRLFPARRSRAKDSRNYITISGNS
ncbi:hypothetical protein EV363DRAFT_1353238 [Boletus edulis]|nr:hypothetical protein EV363DRAFT_1353238 [Boletus edulis]